MFLIGIMSCLHVHCRAQLKADNPLAATEHVAAGKGACPALLAKPLQLRGWHRVCVHIWVYAPLAYAGLHTVR